MCNSEDACLRKHSTDLSDMPVTPLLTFVKEERFAAVKELLQTWCHPQVLIKNPLLLLL
ncbi:hypothetical protein I79_022219 [Cricetulus griseus]|uniref:Uncharacterized protein n=1 Tax=Cricetulus griseus TaxID=10029 RepID=G3IER7_CRIGR|nr:hypothetical protein I79_022219 [Cricetulus griseus]